MLQMRKSLDPVQLQERLDLELESEHIAQKIARGNVAQLEMSLKSIQKQLSAIEAYKDEVLGVDPQLDEVKLTSALLHHDDNQLLPSTQVGDSTASTAVEPDNSNLVFFEPMEHIFRRLSRKKLLGEGHENVLLKGLCQHLARHHIDGTPLGERPLLDIESGSDMSGADKV